MAERIYKVNIISQEGEDAGETKEIRLVRALSPASAERHCFKDVVEAKRATPDDVEELLTKGVKVENASSGITN